MIGKFLVYYFGVYMLLHSEEVEEQASIYASTAVIYNNTYQGRLGAADSQSRRGRERRLWATAGLYLLQERQADTALAGVDSLPRPIRL